MADIRFYHMHQKKLEQALPEILAKALERQHRVVVKASTVEQVETLNHLLWVYDPGSFLPHGTAKEGSGAEQPIWITMEDDNPAQAGMLVLTHGATSPDVEKFSLCCEFFDGQDEQAVLAARARWKAYKEKGYTLTYFQQDDTGRWQQK